MKLGISMWSYFHAYKAGKIDMPGFIHEAKRLGADGVELLDVFYRDKDLDSERKLADQALLETGLAVGVFSVAQNFAKLTEPEREAELEKIKFGVDEAVHFSAKTVRVFAGDVAPGITFDQARDWIIDGLSLAADYAQSKGIRLALENHGKLAGKSDQVRGIIADVRNRCGHNALGANPDTGNFMLVGQKGHDAVLDVADLAYMVHFKDFKKAPADYAEWAYEDLSGQKFLGTVIGEGEVDLRACLVGLQKAGFTGWVNLEYEGVEDPMTGVPKSMENALRFINQVR